jgi:hypothetical protein
MLYHYIEIPCAKHSGTNFHVKYVCENRYHKKKSRKRFWHKFQDATLPSRGTINRAVNKVVYRLFTGQRNI